MEVVSNSCIFGRDQLNWHKSYEKDNNDDDDGVNVDNWRRHLLAQEAIMVTTMIMITIMIVT